MQHFKTYEFVYEFMYMKNIVKSYLKSSVPRFQMRIGRPGSPSQWVSATQAAGRAEVRRSFIITTVREESQVTPQGRHR